MAQVTDLCYEATGRTAFICDFSPPRSGQSPAEWASSLNVDFVSVAYNPGRSVRADSAMLAAHIRTTTNRDVVFTLAARDMNILALQSHLLGAQLLGLENVIVVQGDPFVGRELSLVGPTRGFRATQLIEAIARMNRGADFQDKPLDSPTNFCVGAAVDLGKGPVREARLASRKVRAGAQFLIMQPVFDIGPVAEFEAAYADAAGIALPVPLFCGLQVLEPDSVSFSRVPPPVAERLSQGAAGVELALELYRQFRASGRNNVYLVPPIRRGGSRGYSAARSFLTAIRR